MTVHEAHANLTWTLRGRRRGLQQPHRGMLAPTIPMTPAHIPICSQERLLISMAIALASQKISRVRFPFHFVAGSGRGDTLLWGLFLHRKGKFINIYLKIKHARLQKRCKLRRKAAGRLLEICTF